MVIKYFSWVRDFVGTPEEVIDVPEKIDTTEKLIDYLSKKDNKYKRAFKNRKTIRIALNKEYVIGSKKIRNEVY